MGLAVPDSLCHYLKVATSHRVEIYWAKHCSVKHIESKCLTFNKKKTLTILGPFFAHFLLS